MTERRRWAPGITVWPAMAAFVLVVSIAGCRGDNFGREASEAAAPAAVAKPTYGAFGLDLTARNMSVKPGDDFFAYANGA